MSISDYENALRDNQRMMEMEAERERFFNARYAEMQREYDAWEAAKAAKAAKKVPSNYDFDFSESAAFKSIRINGEKIGDVHTVRIYPGGTITVYDDGLI